MTITRIYLSEISEGQVVQVSKDRLLLKGVDRKSCKDCYFREKECPKDNFVTGSGTVQSVLSCSKYARNDFSNVFFLKINK